MDEHIVISGIGIVSPLGVGIEKHIEILKLGKFKLKEGNGSSFDDIICKVENIDIKKYVKNKKSVKFFSKQTQLGCCATKLSFQDANLTDMDIAENERMNALILGSGHSQSLLPMADSLTSCLKDDEGVLDYEKIGNEGYRKLAPLWILSRLPNTTAGQIAIENGIRGLSYTIVNGVNSGIVSVGEAFYSINQGRAIRVICGGVEDEILPDFVYELKKDNLIIDSSNENKVFGENSKGYLCSEGAALFVVEQEEEAVKRKSEIYGEVIGYSNYYVNDINEIKDPEELAIHFEKAMRKAMDMAQILAEDVSFVQASAGGFTKLDYAEAIAIENLFSNNTYITEAQSYVGNTLAASGAISVAFACLQLKNNFIAPILQEENIILEDKLKYVKSECIENNNEICLVNSFTYLGEMCTLILKRR